jgi:hypothetical protein
MVRGVPSNEKLFIGEDLNGHVGTVREGFERVHWGFGYDEHNQEGEDILNFAITYDLIVANTFFRKKTIAFNYFQQWSAVEPDRFCPDYKGGKTKLHGL